MWLLLSILSPALYSISNFVDKYLVEKKVPDPYVITLLGGFLSGIVGVLMIFVIGFSNIGILNTALIILSGMFLTFYLVPYYSAMKMEDASRVVPYFQFIPIFVLVFSYLFLHEVLNLWQLLGFLVILVGGYLLAIEDFKISYFKLRKSILLVIFSSFLIAISNVIFKFVALKADYWTTLSYQFLGDGVAAFILLMFPGVLKKTIGSLKWSDFNLWVLLSGNEVNVIVAHLAYTWAILLAPIALVAVIAGIQPVFVLTYGLILTLFFPKIIKEDIGKNTMVVKTISIVLIVLGIVAINL